MRILRWVVLCLLFLTVKASAQNQEELSIFDPETDKILIAACKAKVKQVVIHLNTHRTEKNNGDNTKVTFTFLNDSVFEQKSCFQKSLHVVRNGFIYPYDPDPKESWKSYTLVPKDSAGCIVFWGTPSLLDSTDVSYCRIQRDSLKRWKDYYYTTNNTVWHQTWQYEGDSAYWHESYQLHADSMRHISSEYVYQYYNADSSFHTRVIKRYYLPDEIIFPYNDVHESSRTYVTYDDQGRMIEVKIEECALSDGRMSSGCYTHTMKIKYVFR